MTFNHALIKKFRTELGLTQSALAGLMSQSRAVYAQQISEWENHGRIGVDSLGRLAKALGKDVGEFFTDAT